MGKGVQYQTQVVNLPPPHPPMEIGTIYILEETVGTPVLVWTNVEKKKICPLHRGLSHEPSGP
jgi:hypothetical protein